MRQNRPALRTTVGLLIAVLAFAVGPLLLHSPATAAQSTSLVLTHATVVDVTSGTLRPDQALVISGDRIQAMGKSSDVQAPPNATTVNAAGKYVIPGLWDAHVHTRYEGIPFLSLFILNGVTSIRDVAGPWTHLEVIEQWQRDIAAGKLVGPRIVAAGPLLDGPDSRWTHAAVVTSPEEGRQTVQRVKELGGSLIKVYDLLSRDAFYAIVEEAKRRNLPLAGHVPFSVSAGEMSDAGALTIEHLNGFLLAASSREDEFRAQLLDNRNVAVSSTLNTYSEEKAAALIAKFAKNRTAQVLTLSNSWTQITASEKNPEIVSAERLEYVPVSYLQQWSQNPPTASTVQKQVLQKHQEIVVKMEKAGVDIITGTDTLKAYLIPGFSLQDELEILTDGGLTPLEVLQAATINPARVFGIPNLGTVEPGKIADLVLLDANPLENIRNTRKIFAVIAGGRLLDRKALDELAKEAKNSAANWKGTPTGR